jgi:hypothetical protein
MKCLLLALACFACACTSSESSGVKAIVGAKLIAAPGRAPIDYSVVVIEGGKIFAAGPQSSTPVPKGSQITRGLGLTIESVSGGEPIEPGRPANLILKGSTDRTMRDGNWVP